MENLKFLKEINDYNEEDSLLEYELMLKHKVSINKKNNSKSLKPLNNVNNLNVNPNIKVSLNNGNDNSSKISQNNYLFDANSNDVFSNKKLNNLNEKQVDLLFEKSLNILKEHDYNLYLTEKTDSKNFINEMEKLIENEENNNDEENAINIKNKDIMSSQLTVDLNKIIKKSEEKFKDVLNELKKYINKDAKKDVSNDISKDIKNNMNIKFQENVNSDSENDLDYESDSDNKLNLSDQHIYDKIVGIKDKLIGWMNFEIDDDNDDMKYTEIKNSINKVLSNKNDIIKDNTMGNLEENDEIKIIPNKLIENNESMAKLVSNGYTNKIIKNKLASSFSGKNTKQYSNSNKALLEKPKLNIQTSNNANINVNSNVNVNKAFTFSKKYLNKINIENKEKKVEFLKKEDKEIVNKTDSSKFSDNKNLQNKRFDLFNYTDDKFSVVKLQHKRNDRKSLMKNKIVEKVKADKLFKHEFKMKNIDEINLFIDK